MLGRGGTPSGRDGMPSQVHLRPGRAAAPRVELEGVREPRMGVSVVDALVCPLDLVAERQWERRGQLAADGPVRPRVPPHVPRVSHVPVVDPEESAYGCQQSAGVLLELLVERDEDLLAREVGLPYCEVRGVARVAERAVAREERRSPGARSRYTPGCSSSWARRRPEPGPSRVRTSATPAGARAPGARRDTAGAWRSPRGASRLAFFTRPISLRG